MREKLDRLVARADLDGLVSSVLLAIGAEQLVPGAGLFTLGAALYVPHHVERLRQRRA